MELIRKTLWFCLCAFLLAFPALASDLSIPESTLYPFRSSFEVQDDFLGGTTTSGNVGVLGWGVANGTTTQIGSVANRPGLIRRDTSAVLNTIATLSLYASSSLLFDASLPHSILFIDRLNTNDADTLIRIGIANSTGSNPPNDGIYFEKLAADTNYFCVTRATSTETRTDTGIAVNTSFNNFFYLRGTSSVLFYLNGSLVCTHTTNLTAVVSNPFIQIFNAAAAVKTHDVDYFQVKVSGLTR